MSDLDDFFPGSSSVKPDKPEAARQDSGSIISSEAKAEVRAVAAHVRQRATLSARLAHENAAKAAGVAKVLSGSLRDRATSELAKPIAWARVCKAALAPVVLIIAITAGLVWRDQHRVSLAKDDAKAAEVARAGTHRTSAVPPSLASLTSVITSPPSAPAVALPAPVAAPASAPVPAQPAVVAAPPTPPTSPIPLLPVPGAVASGTCAFGLPTFVRLQKEVQIRALSSDENAWIQFGYACVGKEYIAFNEGAFAPIAEKTPKAPAVASENQVADSKPHVASARAKGNSGASRGSSTAHEPTSGAAALTAAQRIPPATNTCSLRGAVVSQDNSPLPGATVFITGLGIAASGTTTTDSNGGFTFAGLPAGQVSVNVEANKHFAQKATLQTCGGSLSAPIRLETCNFLTCRARQIDQKLGLGRH